MVAIIYFSIIQDDQYALLKQNKLIINQLRFIVDPIMYSSIAGKSPSRPDAEGLSKLGILHERTKN